jgi:hypothetical protein
MTIYAETLHRHRRHTVEDYRLPDGRLNHTYPLSTSEVDRQELLARRDLARQDGRWAVRERRHAVGGV